MLRAFFDQSLWVVAVAGTDQSANSGSVGKSAGAFRTIGEVATELGVPRHVLRFWESKFSQIRPMKRGGGRRYYRPEDIDLIRAIRRLLYDEGYTIKGAQRFLRESGPGALLADSSLQPKTGNAEKSSQTASPIDDKNRVDTGKADDPSSGVQPAFSVQPHLKSSQADGHTVAQAELRVLLDELVAIRCLLDDQES